MKDKSTQPENGESSQFGRPTKYKKDFNKQAYKLCLLGATDKQLADFFQINEDTLHEWKKKHRDFSESLRRGKIEADAEVAHSLYKRAKGFTYDEVTFEKIDGKLSLESTTAGEIKTEQAYRKKVVTKMVVPDTGAASLWLTNRQKELWKRDNESGDDDTGFEVTIKKK